MKTPVWDPAKMIRRCATIACLLVLSTIGCVGGGDDHARPATTDDSAQVVSPEGQRDPDAATRAPAVTLQVAMERLLRGDGDQAAAQSWFSVATAGALRSVAIDSSGHAVVDFEDVRTLIPNASSSAGSEMLLHELNATVFSVAAVRSVDYLIEGRCELFWEWLQRSCQTVSRPSAD